MTGQSHISTVRWRTKSHWHNIVHGSNNQYTILYTILHRNSIQKSHYNNQYMSTYGNKCLRWLCSILVYTVGGCYCLRVDMSWSVIRWRSNRCTRTTRGATRASPRMCSVRRGLTSPSLSPVCALYIGFISTMQSKKHPSTYHHHHLVARLKSIAVSTMRRQEGRSVARRNAEWSPRLSGLRSLSIVRSQDWRGRPLGRRQSTGRRSVDARSARGWWSSEAAARAICPNSLRRRCCISEETGGWPVLYYYSNIIATGRYNIVKRCPIFIIPEISWLKTMPSFPTSPNLFVTLPGEIHNKFENKFVSLNDYESRCRKCCHRHAHRSLWILMWTYKFENKVHLSVN